MAERKRRVELPSMHGGRAKAAAAPAARPPLPCYMLPPPLSRAALAPLCAAALEPQESRSGAPRRRSAAGTLYRDAPPPTLRRAAQGTEEDKTIAAGVNIAAMM